MVSHAPEASGSKPKQQHDPDFDWHQYYDEPFEGQEFRPGKVWWINALTLVIKIVPDDPEEMNDESDYEGKAKF